MAPSGRLGASRKSYGLDRSLYNQSLDTPKKGQPRGNGESINTNTATGTGTGTGMGKRRREDPVTATGSSKRKRHSASSSSSSEDDNELRSPGGRTILHPALHDPPVPADNYQVEMRRTPSYIREMVPSRGGGGGQGGQGQQGKGRKSAMDGRRKSLENRGRRGSNIGSGFEAGPHPNVLPSQLYRHIPSSQPPALRLRTLLSWVARYRREKLYRAAGATTTGTAEANLEFVKPTVDRFTRGLANLELDVSWRTAASGGSSEEQKKSSKSSTATELPDNPINLSNRLLWDGLERRYSSIATERAERQEVVQRYQSLSARQGLLRPPSAGAGGKEIKWDLPLPVFRTEEEVWRHGRAMEGLLSTEQQKDGEMMEVDAAVKPFSIDPLNLRVDASAILSATHRLSQFALLLQTYSTSRLSLVNDQLASLSSSAGQGQGEGREVEGELAPAVRAFATLGTLGGGAGTQEEKEGGKERRKEQRELLGAIARGGEGAAASSGSAEAPPPQRGGRR